MFLRKTLKRGCCRLFLWSHEWADTLSLCTSLPTDPWFQRHSQLLPRVLPLIYRSTINLCTTNNSLSIFTLPPQHCHYYISCRAAGVWRLLSPVDVWYWWDKNCMRWLQGWPVLVVRGQAQFDLINHIFGHRSRITIISIKCSEVMTFDIQKVKGEMHHDIIFCKRCLPIINATAASVRIKGALWYGKFKNTAKA